jgi:hypothetical protein
MILKIFNCQCVHHFFGLVLMIPGHNNGLGYDN